MSVNTTALYDAKKVSWILTGNKKKTTTQRSVEVFFVLVVGTDEGVSFVYLEYGR